MLSVVTNADKGTRTRLPAREVAVTDLDGDRRDDLVLLDSTRTQITLVDHALRGAPAAGR